MAAAHDASTVAELSDPATLVNLGACGLLAFLTLRGLRDHYTELKQMREAHAANAAATTGALSLIPKLLEVLTSVQITQAGLLEYERMRSARWHARAAAQPGEAWDDVTKPFDLPTTPAPPKRGTDPFGYRAPTKPGREP